MAGVIFRGTALGDWTLAFVRGRLISATFVFRDGTLRTVRGTEQEPLGEIADEFGVPCVSGERVSNAASYLSQRVLVGAAGDAAAASQSTNTVSGLTGVGTTTVTGEIGRQAQQSHKPRTHEAVDEYLQRERESWEE